MKSQARGMQFHLKKLRHRGFPKNFMKSLILTNSKNACERLFLYKFFDNLDDSNTHPDEIDAEHLSWSFF